MDENYWIQKTMIISFNTAAGHMCAIVLKCEWDTKLYTQFL